MFINKKNVILLTSFVLYLPFYQGIIVALPQNAQVIEGNAGITFGSDHCMIQAGDKTVIHWDSFSIAKNETAHFQLPSGQSAVLNRVTGIDSSFLSGQLHSNGLVYLINPHGIVIGKEGLIQTNGFLASTLEVSNQSFLKGKDLVFKGDSLASIENRGRIVAGEADIALIAHNIKNAGQIEAQRGVVAIGAGQEIVYLPYGDERIQVVLHSGRMVAGEAPGIHQTGLIKAGHTELKSDGNLYGFAIKNEGMLEAACIEDRDGSVYLVAEKGHVNHSGTITASEVRILGEQVTLTGNATVNASDLIGGGEVLIGGDYQGANPAVLNAKATLIEQDVHIYADALQNGQGGKVVVWADEATGFYGTISARGGMQSGNGGFVEVSAKDHLEFTGRVNMLAPNGKVGTLLLDPTDITISSAATDAGITFGGACGINTYCNTGVLSPRNIQDTTILTQLGLSDVIVNSTLGGPAGGNGDITFSAGSPFTWTGINSNTFTLNARRNININAAFTNSTTAGNVIFNAGQGVLGVLTIAATGSISHSSSGAMTLNSTFTGSDIIINGPLNVTGGSLGISFDDDLTIAATGSISFNSSGNTFTYSSLPLAGSVSTWGGTVSILNGNCNITAGLLNINNSLVTAGTGNTVMTAASTVTKNATGMITHGSSGTFSLSSTTAAAITLNAPFIQTGGNVTINAGTSLNINNNFTNSSISSNTTLRSGTIATGSIIVAAASTIGHSSNGTLTLDADTMAVVGSDITLTGALNVTAGNLSILLDDDFVSTAVTGTINFNSPGNTFTFSTSGGATSACTFGAPITINGISNWTPSGSITFNSGLTVAGTGAMTLNAGGSIVTGAAANVNYSSTGDLDWNTTLAGSDITIGGPLTVSNANATFMPQDDFTLNATTGSINFSAAGRTLLFDAGASTSYNFNGAVNVTGGNMTINAVDDITIAATTGSITYNVPSGMLLINSVGGADPDFAINGALTINNGSLTANTFDDILIGAGGSLNFNSTGSAILTASGPTGDIACTGPVIVTGGSMTMNASQNISFASSLTSWSSSGNWIMNAAGDISIGAGMTVSNGSVSMTAGDDLVLTGTINWTSPGTFNMMNTIPSAASLTTVNGLVNFTNGTWNIDSQGTVTFAGTSVINYSAPNSFMVISHLGDMIFNGSVNLNTPALFSATTDVGDMFLNNLVTNVSTGSMQIDAGDDFFIGDSDNTIPSQIGSAGGQLNIQTAHEIIIESSDLTLGANATIGFSSGGQVSDININTGSGMRISARRDHQASITSTGNLDIVVGGDLYMLANQLTTGTCEALIRADLDLNIQARDFILTGGIDGPLVNILSTNGNMLLVAENSFSSAFDVLIHNNGPGSLTLVVDQQAPFPPVIGNGKLFLLAGSSLSTNGGALDIFTAAPSQNRLDGLVNGSELAQGIQISEVYFSTYTGPSFSPFTIFYKTGSAPPPPVPPNIDTGFSELVTANAEMTQRMIDRTMGWSWSCPYSICYASGIPLSDAAEKDCMCSGSRALYKRKPFEYPIFLPPCCDSQDFVK